MVPIIDVLAHDDHVRAGNISRARQSHQNLIRRRATVAAFRREELHKNLHAIRADRRPHRQKRSQERHPQFEPKHAVIHSGKTLACVARDGAQITRH
jgi:hypothetical protein